MFWSSDGDGLFCGCIPLGISGGRQIKVINSKFETCKKTGVLNLSDGDLADGVWQRIRDEELQQKIKTLDVSGNQMKTLPGEVNTLENMKTLHASRCGIQRVPALSSLSKLAVLSLDKNDLETVAALPMSLTRLSLASNHIATFPTALASLVAVAELDLSSNRLESLTGIGGMTGLVSLTLDGNCLCELPEEAGRLLKLRQISLKNNRFSKKAFSHDGQSKPASFFVQTLVDTIDLGGNPGLTKALVLDFDGVQSFVERRKKAKDKSLQGGALTDFNLFGLD